MRAFIREFLRSVILLFSEEWGKAQHKVKTMQAAYRIEALCDAELHVFRAALADLEAMHHEAAQAIARVPSARGLINEMLQERMQHVARTVREESRERRVIPLKSVK